MDSAFTSLAENSFSVFLLYLIISSNWMAPLFSCRLQRHISESMILRHFLGFLTLTFFIVIASKTKPFTFAQVIGFSTLFYLWFIFTTRMHIGFWVVVITLMGAVYLIHLYQSDLTSDEPSEEEKKKLTLSKQVIASIAGVVTFIGFVTYLGEKKIEYKEKFNYFSFFLGAPSCKGASPKVTLVESFQAAFTR